MADLPDHEYIAYPRDAALTLCRLVLEKWQVPDTEQEALLTGASTAVLSDLLVSHLLLRVLFEDEAIRARWVHQPNKAFEERVPLDLIRSGESWPVRQYLAHHVFNGGW